MKIFNKINKIQIKNFRRFDNISLEFKKGNYFVLAGRNAVGKTSILEAINIAFSERSSKFTETKESDFYSDDPIEFVVELDNYFFLSFDGDNGFQRLIPCKKFLKRISRRTKKERGSYFSPSYEISWEFLPDKFDVNNRTFMEVETKFKDALDKNQKIVRYFEETGEHEFEYSIKTKPNIKKPNPPFIGFQYMKKVLFPEIFYYDNNRERELLSGYNTTIANIINELDWRYKKGLTENKDRKREILKFYDDILTKISNLLSTSKSKSYTKELFKTTKKIIREKLEINEVNIESLSFFPFNYYQPHKSSTFGFKTSQDQIVSVLSIGSGITNLLSLALSISFAQENDNPIIILIDEPEIHLQADLQKRLCKYLKQNSDFQTIVATHSHLFIDKAQTKNNILLEDNAEKIEPRYCEQIDITDLQFRLLGNSIDDLIIPERILLVEGKYDKNIISRCLQLLNKQDLNIQIIPAGGKDNIPNKSERYEYILNEILKKGKWYSDIVIKIIKIIVDNDVPDNKIESWVTKYGFDKKKQVKRLEASGIEYLFPESLIKQCVEDSKLRDGTNLKDKSKSEIIKIIFDDDKLSNKDECKQIENRVSKSRLNEFVVENINEDILSSNESESLKNLINFISD